MSAPEGQTQIQYDPWYATHKDIIAKLDANTFDYKFSEMSEWGADWWAVFVDWMNQFQTDNLVFPSTAWAEGWDNANTISLNALLAKVVVTDETMPWGFGDTSESDADAVIKSFCDACVIAYYEINDPYQYGALQGQPNPQDQTDPQGYETYSDEQENTLQGGDESQTQEYTYADVVNTAMDTQKPDVSNSPQVQVVEQKDTAPAANLSQVKLAAQPRTGYQADNAKDNAIFRGAIQGLLGMSAEEFWALGNNDRREGKKDIPLAADEKLIRAYTEGNLDGGTATVKVSLFEGGAASYLNERNRGILQNTDYEKPIRFAQFREIVIFESNSDPIAFQLISALYGSPKTGTMTIVKQKGFKATVSGTDQLYVTVPGMEDNDLTYFANTIGPAYKSWFKVNVKVKEGSVNPNTKASFEF